MVAIRRSGGMVAFYWQGRLPDARDTAFTAALAAQRFRTIEHAASEEIAVGWVTAADPTGDSFAAEDLEAGPAVWLRCRIDRKTLPRKWVMIHREAAEKVRGRRLSARERRELVDELTSRLLPRVLPTVNLVDALLFPGHRLLLLFAAGKAVREAFAKLFFATFALPLDRVDPLQLGLHAGLGPELEAALQRAEPVRWPRHEAHPDPVAIAAVRENDA